jgi:hypothetical protein
MKLNARAFEWNKYALAMTVFFTAWLILKSNLVPGLPNCLTILTCPTWYQEVRLIVGTPGVVVGALAGLKASRSFGGRKNFTGRILYYFSFFVLFAFGPIYILFIYFDALPNPFSNWLSYNVLLPYSGIDVWESALAYVLPAYALVVSLRSVWDRFDLKSWMIILFSLASSSFLAWFNLLYGNAAGGYTTFLDAVLNVEIVPLLTFVQLAAAGLLWRSLGRWYVAKSVKALIGTYLFLGLVAQIIAGVLFAWLAGFGSTNPASSPNLDVPYFIASIEAIVAQYAFCMVLTQIKPRTSGRYF